MKYNCELIKDIMPLFKDNALGDTSMNIVKEHLEECISCREYYEQTDTETEHSTNSNNTVTNNENHRVKKYSKKIKHLRLLITCSVLAVVILISSSFLSFSKFYTYNPISTVCGFIHLTLTDNDYTTIQSNPRVIISKPEHAWDAFMSYLEEQGYEYLKEERMGGLCVIEKNGEREYVVVSLNRYYSMWRWEPKNNV